MARLLTLSSGPGLTLLMAGVGACSVLAFLHPVTHRQELERDILLLLIAILPLSLVLYRYSELLLRASSITRRQHQLFKAAAEGSLKSFALYKPVCDRRGRVVDFRLSYANHSAKRALGLDLQGGLRRSLKQAIRSKGEESAVTIFARVLALGHAERIIIRVLHCSEPDAFLEAGADPLGSCVALSVTHNDLAQVTPERILELQEFTQSVIENAPMSMIATDASGMIIAMNVAAEQLTLYSRTELMGKHSLTLLHDPLELQTRAEELSRLENTSPSTAFDAITSKPRASESCREWAYIRKDGTRAYVSLVVTTLLTPSRRITGYLCTGVDITERRRLTDSVTHLAQYDQLTGLANRSLLNERIAHDLDQARVFQRRLAVFMIDVDYFKRVNESLGHHAGDEVLTYIARQLGDSLQTRGTVARVGGDEFVVLLPNVEDHDEAERYAMQMLHKISAPVTISGREVRMTASIGLSNYPDDGDTGDALLREADRALNQAKADGRNCLHIFSAEMRREAADRLEMEEELRHALARREFELHYQPQVSCSTGRVTGMEMLLRWTNPRRGNVPPNVFLPIAEQAGLLIEIGEWSLQQACLDCRMAQEAAGRLLQVAVNLSPRQVARRNLVSLVKKALADSGLDATQLELEITEEILMANTPHVKNNLKQLRDLGCSVAIDDFGTGFSSFSYILEYRVDRLKIDRSFISQITQDEHARAIVRAIIAMGRGLDLNLVAEGVETPEQLAFLLQKRCDSIQGWFFSKAVPISGLVSAIRTIEEQAKDGMVLSDVKPNRTTQSFAQETTTTFANYPTCKKRETTVNDEKSEPLYEDEDEDPPAYPHHPARPAWSRAPTHSMQVVANPEQPAPAPSPQPQTPIKVPTTIPAVVIRPRKLST